MIAGSQEMMLSGAGHEVRSGRRIGAGARWTGSIRIASVGAGTRSRTDGEGDIKRKVRVGPGPGPGAWPGCGAAELKMLINAWDLMFPAFLTCWFGFITLDE